MAKKTRRKAKTNKKTVRRSRGNISSNGLPPVSLSTAELAAELKRRQRGVNVLNRRRERLMSQLEDVNVQIAELGGNGMGVTASGKTRNAQTLPDALHGVLQGREMSVIEAVDAVRASGYVSGAANFRTMVNQVLLKDKRFKKVRRGVYTSK